MEFEDSRNALFAEPNAYISNFHKKDKPKKVVFSEPYECVPNFYLNNNFKKKNCNCIPIKKQSNCFCNNVFEDTCECEKNYNKSEKCNKHISSNNNLFNGLNLQSLLPLLGLFNKNGKGGLDFSSVMNLVGGKSDNNFLSNLLNNKDLFSNISNLFTNKIGKRVNPELKPTEIDINTYTKVD